MSEASQCPSSETLALLPDGRARGRLRISLMVHLDRCTSCRRVVAFTGQYEASCELGPSEDARKAFRIGVQLSSLRGAVEEGRRLEALAAIRALRSLSDSKVFSDWVALEDAPPRCLARQRFLEDVERLEGTFARELDPAALALGSWAGASRLASIGGHRSYFAGPYFRRMVAGLEERYLADPVEKALRQIKDASAGSFLDFKRVEKAIGRLLALF